MYFIRMTIGCHDIGAARTSCLILMIVIALYATAFVGAVNHVQWMIVGIGAAATVTGMFLPFVIRGHFDASIISFPHLSERFELLTIITFGEGVVGMARFFDVHSPSPLPALIFTLMLLMFGCYMIQLHDLCDHHRVDRALRLMFTHYFIVIAINLMTIGLEMLPNDGVDRMFLAVLCTVSLAVFFGSIYANSVYNAPSVRFTMSDGVWCAASLLLGCAMAICLRASNIGIVCALLIPVTANFAMLLRKRWHQRFGDGAIAVKGGHSYQS